MSDKDIKVIEYVNSIKWLTPQQKAKIVASATTIEDVSIMLKVLSSEADFKADTSVDNSTNSVWQNKTNTNSNPQDFSPTFSSSSAEGKPVVKSQNEPEIVRQNFFANTPHRNALSSSGKKYYPNGVLQESTEKELNGNGKLANERIKEYDEKGKITQIKFNEYSDNERLLLRETSEMYDKNEALLYKKSVNYKYDSQERAIEEMGENYDENGKPVKSYITKNEPNEKGYMVKVKTDRYSMDGTHVSSETYKSELIKKDNINKSADIVYDKDGKISKKIVNDTYYSEKGKEIKSDWQFYEKDNIVQQQVTEYGEDGVQTRQTIQKYNKNSIVERTVDENDKFSSSITEKFDDGKITDKKTTTSIYDYNGNKIKETIADRDADGKFLSKEVISRRFKTNQKNPDGIVPEVNVVVEKYNEKNKLINKTVNTIQRDSEDFRTSETTNIYNGSGILKENIHTKYKARSGMDFPVSQIKTKYKGGKIFSTETIQKSEVSGEYNYKTQGGKENVANFIDVKKSENGANIIKKFESPDGTKTDYQYSEDNKGNTKLLYKIIDKNGIELMSTAREYQKVSDKLSISKVDGKEYRIETENNKINVFDVTNKKSTQIDLDKLVKGNNVELKNVIKGQPGDILIGLSKEINKIGADVDNGSYSRNEEEYITSDNEPSTIAHEYGHSVDSAPNEVNENVFKISENEDFMKIFSEEQKNFKNSSVESEQEAFSYLEDLNEFVAEAKMVTTTRNDKDCNAMRGIILMKNFPKSISVANKLLKETEASDKQKKVL